MRKLLLIMFLTVCPQVMAEPCTTDFVIAEFPEILPTVGQDACPTSKNMGPPQKIILQNFELTEESILEFKDRYINELESKGWTQIKYEKLETSPMHSLSAVHTEGLKLQMMMTNVIQLGKAGAFKPGNLDPEGMEVKGLNLKLILKKKNAYGL